MQDFMFYILALVLFYFSKGSEYFLRHCYLGSRYGNPCPNSVPTTIITPLPSPSSCQLTSTYVRERVSVLKVQGGFGLEK